MFKIITADESPDVAASNLESAFHTACALETPPVCVLDCNTNTRYSLASLREAFGEPPKPTEPEMPQEAITVPPKPTELPAASTEPTEPVA